MDEIDAALGKFFVLELIINFELCLNSFSFSDFKNVSIVGHYVKDRTKDAQFIIIRYPMPLHYLSTFYLKVPSPSFFTDFLHCIILTFTSLLQSPE